MADFTLNKTVNYYPNSPADAALTAIPDNGYAEPISVTITTAVVLTGDARFKTGEYGNTASVWTKELGRWYIEGTRSEVNSALAALKFYPMTSTTDTTATVVVKDAAGTQIGDGTITLNGQTHYELTADIDSPVVTVDPPTTQAYTVNGHTKIDFGELDETQNTLLYVIGEIRDMTDAFAGTTYGTLDSGFAASTKADYNSGYLTYRGSKKGVNALLGSLYYKNNGTTNDIKVRVTFQDGYTEVWRETILYNGVLSSTNLNQSVTLTEDAAASKPFTDPIISGSDYAEITATLTLSDAAAATLTTGTYGSSTSTFSAGVWQIVGNRPDVNAALADLEITLAANYDQNFTIGLSITNGLNTISGTWTVNVTAVDDPFSVYGNSGTKYWTEDTTYNLSQIRVTDPDTAGSYSVSLTLSDASAGTLSSTNGGSFSAGVWSVSGNLTTVNDALSALAFTPASNYDTSFTIATSVTDSVTTINGTIAMECTPVADDVQLANVQSNFYYSESQTNNMGQFVTVEPDSTGTFSATFTLSDAAAGVLDTTNVGACTHSWATGVLTINGSVKDDLNATIGNMTFTPAVGYRSNFTIAVNVSNSGVASASATINAKVVALNATYTHTWTEDAAYSFSPNHTVIQVADAGTYTASVTLSSTAAGALSSTLGSYNSGTAEWTYSGTKTDVNTALQNLVFTPSSNYDVSFTAAVVITLPDASTATGTYTMTATPVNDAAVITLPSGSTSYYGDVASPLGVTIDEPDSDASTLTVTCTLSNTSAGSLSSSGGGSYNASTGVWSMSGATASVEAAANALEFTPAAGFKNDFTISINTEDEDALTSSAILNMKYVLANGTYTHAYTEDTNYNFSPDVQIQSPQAGQWSVSLTLSDSGAGSITVSNGATFSAGVWSISAAVADANAALANAVFQPTADYYANFTVAVSVTSPTGVTSSGTLTMNGTAVADPSAITGVTSPRLYGTGDNQGVGGDFYLFSDLSVDDPDGSNATLTVSATLATNLFIKYSSAETWTGTYTFTGSTADINTRLQGLHIVADIMWGSPYTVPASFVAAITVDDGTAAATTENITFNPLVDFPTTSVNYIVGDTFDIYPFSDCVFNTTFNDITVTVFDPVYGNDGSATGHGTWTVQGGSTVNNLYVDYTGTAANCQSWLRALGWKTATNINGPFLVVVSHNLGASQPFLEAEIEAIPT